MPLTQCGLTNSLIWSLTRTNAGYYSTTNSDSLTWNLNGIKVTSWNQILTLQLTLSASTADTIDLTTYTNLVCESVSFASVMTIIVQPTGGSVKFGPASSHSFQWWFTGTTQSVTIPNGGLFVASNPPSGPGNTVTSSSKWITVSNPGSTTSTVDIIIIGQPAGVGTAAGTSSAHAIS